MGIIYDYLIDLQHKGILTLPLDNDGNPLLESAEADKWLRILTSTGMIALEGETTLGNNHIFNDHDRVVLSTADGITFVDNTATSLRDDGTTFDMFNGGTAIGACLYVGSDESDMFGVRRKMTGLVPGTGSIAQEYWNGAAWVEMPVMISDAETPYTQRAWTGAGSPAIVNIRFGDKPGHVACAVDGVTKYWMRTRVTGAITTPGTIDHLFLHASNWKTHADGFREFFGNGIRQRDLTMHWMLMEHLNGISPSDEMISFASGLELLYTDNEFVDAKTDGIGGYVVIPEGLDTSRGVDLEVLWTPLSNNAGDVVYQIDTYQTRVGDTLTTGNAAETMSDTSNIALNSDNLLKQDTFTICIKTLLPGEILIFGLKRIGADGADTFNGNIALVNVRVKGYFWS